MEAAVMFNVAVPVLVSVIVWEELLPTLMLLKDAADGLINNFGTVVLPVPLRPIGSGDPGALLMIETVPLALPEAVGVKVTVNEVDAPALSVPAVKPLTAKPVPEALAADRVIAAVPGLVSLTDVELLLPTSTLPKLMLEGFAESAPCVPVPLSAMERVGFVAFELIVIVPDALPAAAGEKLAANES